MRLSIVFSLLIVPLLALVSACEGTGGANLLNTPPQATILEPEDGQTIEAEDGIIELRCRASDLEDLPDELQVEWISTIDGLLSDSPLDTAGYGAALTSPLSYGEHGIELRITDTSGEVGSDTITLVVSPGPPNAWIESPLNGASFLEGEDVVAVGRGEDALGGMDLAFAWSWSTNPDDPPLELASGRLSEGTTTLTSGDFPIGDIELQLEVTDDWGSTTTATVSFEVREPDPEEEDVDGDGFTPSAGDCNDNDASIYPGAEEVCDNEDNDCDGDTDEGFDLDGDGWTTCAGDCDDSRDSIHPGAVEECNGVDDDCNDLIDDGIDMDGDGVTVCGGDCDDGDASMYPGALEACDGDDDNCNGTIDEGHDSDGDGWTWCGGDCNDLLSSISPVAPEGCDGIDNDCDGYVDDGFDSDGDGWTACGGDCDDANPFVRPGGTEVCDGVDNDCDGNADEGFDDDGDGWTTCEGDCDDLQRDINPLAEEVCDAWDNDCDGQVNEDFAGILEAWETDETSDGYNLGDQGSSLVVGGAGGCYLGTSSVDYGLDPSELSLSGTFHSEDDTTDAFFFQSGVAAETADALALLGLSTVPMACSEMVATLEPPPLHDYALHLDVETDGTWFRLYTSDDPTPGAIESLDAGLELEAETGDRYRIVVDPKGAWVCGYNYSLVLSIP